VRVQQQILFLQTTYNKTKFTLEKYLQSSLFMHRDKYDDKYFRSYYKTNYMK